MLQPFESFREGYIDRLMQVKKYFLVSQYYPRGEGKSDHRLYSIIGHRV